MSERRSSGVHLISATTAAPLTVGVIGAGDIVRAVHLPVLKALPDTSIAWITDVDAGRADALARSYRVPSVSLPKQLDALPDADIYLLAIPFGVRGPYYEALRGRHGAIYAEKPFAIEVAQHDLLCDWFPAHALASGLMMRSWGANRSLAGMARSQTFGPLRRARFGYGHPGMVTAGRFYLDRSRGGGGMLGELAIHGIDTVLHVAGASGVKVDDVERGRVDGSTAHTKALLIADTDGDSVEVEIVVSALSDTIEGVEFEFEYATVSYPLPGFGYALHGEQVDMTPIVRPLRGGEPFRLTPFAGGCHPATKSQMFAEYYRRFIGGIRDGEANETSAAASRLTTQVIESLENDGAQ
ncbi:MAG: Gfo/Idh/MocA family protein [Acidimicrobiia bacterium]